MATFVSLLRGINVSRRKTISMKETPWTALISLWD
ncbi:MAG: DUF1697 domain-containing protein [Proteobacteria bacterium]|nr:DUF1697 domain-containing protein [Pseudomonadota bacterium]